MNRTYKVVTIEEVKRYYTVQAADEKEVHHIIDSGADVQDEYHTEKEIQILAIECVEGDDGECICGGERLGMNCRYCGR